DFSNAEIKRRTRQIARSVLEQLPLPGSLEAKEMAGGLSTTGRWRFRRKQRLDSNQSEFASLNAWLAFVRSDQGVRNAGGGITRYAVTDEIDKINFEEEVRQMARLFRPFMERVVADAPPTMASWPVAQPSAQVPGPVADLPAFGDLLRTFLHEFAIARSGPFQKTDPLWNAMSNLKRRLEQF